MFENEDIDRYMHCIMPNLKKKCTGLHIFLADLNIDHCVELTSLEADWVDFLY